MSQVSITHLTLSPGHNYSGHHGREPDAHPIIEKDALECVAGRGIVGDRYFDFAENFKGQITFFDLAVFRNMIMLLGVEDRRPTVVRRNVFLEGADLNSLISVQFRLQGVLYEGVEECRPCYWMDQAVGPGAEVFLKGQGGLRARILSSGTLKKAEACELELKGAVTHAHL